MRKGIFAFGLERLGLVCMRAPVASLVVLFAITVIAALGTGMLRSDDDLRRLFRSGSDLDRSYERLVSEFPAVEDELLLLFESDKPLTKAQLERMRELHIDLKFIEGVTGVASMFSARERPDADGNAVTLLPEDLPEGSELEARLRQVRNHAIVSGRLLSEDLHSALFLVSLTERTRKFKRSHRVMGELTELIQPIEAEAGIRITATGSLALRHDILEMIRRDLHVLNGLGAVIAIVICFAFLRSGRLMVVTAVPPIAAVGWTLGGFAYAGLAITPINNVLPTLILVIAFCDALHMVQNIRRRMGEGEDVRTAVREAVLRVGPACAMTSLTTMVACLSLALSASHSVRDFGLLGAVSVFSAYLSVITLVPILSLLLLKPERHGLKPVAPDLLNRFLDKASRRIWKFVAENHWGIAVASIPLLLSSGLLYFLVGTSYDYRTYLSPTKESNKAIDRINAKFGGADMFYILVENRKPAGDGKVQIPGALRAVHEIVEADGKSSGVFSAVTIENWLGSAQANSEIDSGEILEKLPKHYAKRFVSESRQDWLVSATIPATPAPETRKTLLEIDRKLDAVRGKYKDVRVSVTGIVPLGAFASDSMINGLKISLATAVLITIIMIAISVRSIGLALLSAIPNLLPLTLVASAIYLVGSSFQINGVLALTIAFGIAIDNTIHVLNRLQIEQANAPVKEALGITIKKIGPVLIAATVLLSSGIAVTQVSNLPVMHLFGKLTITVLVLALFTAMFILPALIATVHGRISSAKAKSG